MKFRMPLRKLSDLDVKYVSLVDRGANRIPFRIIKSQEKDMSLDLSALGFRVKKQDAEKALTAPAVVTGVIFAHGDEETASVGQAILKAGGIDLTETLMCEDGTIAIHKSDVALEDGTVVRLNASVAVILKASDNQIAELKKSAFGDIAEAQGYFDGPSQAMAVGTDSVRAVLQKTDDQAAAATAVRDSMESIAHYMDLVTKMLPTEILKLEVQLENLVKASAKEGEVVEPVVDPVAAEVEKSGVAPLAKKKPADQAEGSTEDGEDPAEEEMKDKKPMAKEDDSLAQVLKAVGDLATQMATISKTVETLSGEVKTIQKSTEQKIDVLAKKADTATHAVRGTVISSDLPSDPVPLARVKKADSDPRAGIFDTAFIRR